MKINWEKRWWLVPTVIQDFETLEVLTLAYSNKESFEKLLETKQTYLYSTSRKKIWKKGETSWNTQEIKEILVDCDNDAIVIKVKKNWPACHLGNESCFTCRDTLHVSLENTKQYLEENIKYLEKNRHIQFASTKNDNNIFHKLENIISKRLKENNENSYTISLKWKNWNKVLEKIIEEAWELILSLKDKNKKEIIWEFSDLLFHSLVALKIQNIWLKEIEKELEKRFDKNGILEKKLRNKKIVIIDYWSWNIKSVENCLSRLWVDFETTSNKDKVENSDLIIFPWVWHAKYAMQQLKKLALIDTIKNYKKPFLWICLWMQLLFERSEEWDIETLWIIDWVVKKFENDFSTEGFNPLSVPHMGWNNITKSKGLKPSVEYLNNKYFYFVHSYFCPINKYTIETTNYIENFSSVVNKNNFFGCQFHPEKSWKTWEEFLKKFLINNL